MNNQRKPFIQQLIGWIYVSNMIKKKNFFNKQEGIGDVIDVIDQKVMKGNHEMMNELKLFHDQLGCFRRDLACSSHEVLQPSKR